MVTLPDKVFRLSQTSRAWLRDSGFSCMLAVLELVHQLGFVTWQRNNLSTNKHGPLQKNNSKDCARSCRRSLPKAKLTSRNFTPLSAISAMSAPNAIPLPGRVNAMPFAFYKHHH